MLVKKGKFYKYIFLLILTLMTIFNGGNSNLFIQFNFIIVSIYFLFFIKKKNYLAELKYIFYYNKISIYLFFLFIGFLIFQSIPLPSEWIKVLSPQKYDLLNKLEFSGNSHSISLSPTNSFFGILNYVTLFLFLIIFKILFNKKKDIFIFYFFLISLGAFAASVAIYFYLIGNPDFLIIKNNAYKSSATGFFINRTVFSCFLVLCFYCGIEYLKLIDNYLRDNTHNFFKKIYVRIFILLITIGIITTFSKLGNFLLVSVIIINIAQMLYLNDKKNKLFLYTLILIVLFDIFIIGFYFGSEKLLERYSFLKQEIIEYLPSTTEINFSRGDISKFALSELKNFLYFGYGGGGFEYLFKINYENSSSVYATHAHSDIIEFIGEFGIIGSFFILLSIFFLFIKNNIFCFKNFLLFYLLLFMLIFDFSFHIPIIQFILIILMSINYEKHNNFNIN
tara:strand:+ start:218 stop:1567 length:1350 start_codon:yes stop_codon:yes gene_type:complete